MDERGSKGGSPGVSQGWLIFACVKQVVIKSKLLENHQYKRLREICIDAIVHF